MEVAPSKRILWLQVWGLAAVQGAIALTWVIYNLYLKTLLVAFGFPVVAATAVIIIENLLAALMEPLMGSLSDNMQYWFGSRFPFVAFGTVIASACFNMITTIYVFGSDTGPIRWLLPIMMVAWALAMTIFRSPVLSLLGRYAFATNLPQAASILTLVGGLAGALGPISSQLILQLGPLFAFTAGSIVMLVGAAALRWVGPNQQVQAQPMAQDPTVKP
ncbi:MAG: MFS transporter, partial [Cyanobacteria bacterium P01_H01_bin.121]